MKIKMKIGFVVFAPFHANKSHSVRLRTTLAYLSKIHEVVIFNLSDEKNNDEFLGQYPSIEIINHPIVFNGWSMVNVASVARNILQDSKDRRITLLVVTLEIWDLMYELQYTSGREMPVAFVLHAMPFVGAPDSVSASFGNDITSKLNANIPDYRKQYILDNVSTAEKALREMTLIAANKTVAFYVNNYFPGVSCFEYDPPFGVISSITHQQIVSERKYDFIYMARIESGKGLECLTQVMPLICKEFTSTIRLAVVGTPEDELSKRALDELCSLQQQVNLHLDHIPWANSHQKTQLLGQSRVFLYPSLYDTYAIVVHEALEHGLSVVCWETYFSSFHYRTTSAVHKIQRGDIYSFASAAVELLMDNADKEAVARHFKSSLPLGEALALAESTIYEKIAMGTR